MILTRNTRLLRAKGVSACVFIEPDHFRQQLKQVVETLQLDVTGALLSRCVECNQALQAVPKAEVQTLVPNYVWSTQSAFRRCPRCKRIYWAASHRANILAELKRMDLLAETADR